ncbi:winged helix-turn-helix domain-containing protein [Shewanella donghaensis]|uniref:winged helix-turn-helix domain-containing protein n=1 Tax=Shewanella donghaensis TaxID=238836 RepID=UPI001184394D|nr:winged helix-turn-helix domain-containing protein [Shewanella donghaensis]
MLFRFNNIEIDTERYQISKEGLALSIEPKVYDLIIYLIENRSRIISRDELLTQVWAGREVSDTTLSNHIKSARKALGDNGEQQKVINTIRSRGYHFIADVAEYKEPLSTPGNDSNNSTDSPINQTNSKPAATIKLANTIKNNRRKLAIIGLFSFITIIIFSGVNLQKSPSAQAIKEPYLLVVPMSISSNDIEQWQPFADQITRELIQDLRKVSGIKVVPPPSAFTFKANKVRTHIKEQLPEVNFVLDGVVKTAINGDLRFTAELENIDTGIIIWDGSFDIQVDKTNFFTSQNDIASSISSSLQVIILEDEKVKLTHIPTRNLAAYERYIEGQYLLSQMSHDSVLQAIDYYSQAITLDKNFEAAYIAKANAYRILMILFEKPKDVLPKVIASATELLAINPNSASVQASLGMAYIHAMLWEDAWVMLNRAKKLDPNLALTELGFALYYTALGEADKVQLSVARADNLDPLNQEIAEWGLWALMMVGEVDAAIAWGKRKIQQHPQMPYPLLSLSVAHYINGDIEQSITLARQGVALSHQDPFPLILLAQAYAAGGHTDKVLPLIKQATQQQLYMCPYETAVIFALMDQTEKVFPLLDQAVEYQSNCLIFAKHDPRFAGIRHDPRYMAMLAKLGLDDASIKRYSK